MKFEEMFFVSLAVVLAIVAVWFGINRLTKVDSESAQDSSGYSISIEGNPVQFDTMQLVTDSGIDVKGTRIRAMMAENFKGLTIISENIDILAGQRDRAYARIQELERELGECGGITMEAGDLEFVNPPIIGTSCTVDHGGQPCPRYPDTVRPRIDWGRARSLSSDTMAYFYDSDSGKWISRKVDSTTYRKYLTVPGIDTRFWWGLLDTASQQDTTRQ